MAPLAPGEILLQTNALGQVATPGDRAVLSLLVAATGADEAAARRALRTKLDRIGAGLRTEGIAPADVETGATTIGINYAGLSPDLAMLAAARDVRNVASSAAAGEGDAGVTANAALSITFRDVSRLDAVRDMLIANGVELYTQPLYSLADDATQRREARHRALARARVDAEAHAASLNLRVVRVVRVTERIGLDVLGLTLSDTNAFSSLFARFGRLSRDVDIVAAVGVDFALAPR
jgi:uncharacterized protein